jgi:hypothetical protein
MTTQTSTKAINRANLLEFIAKIQGLKHIWQEGLTGKNFWFLGNDKNEPYYQLEFIPQSNKYFFTIYIRGLQTEDGADPIHEEVLNYLKKLELGRNIVLSTDSQNSIV